MEGTGAVPQDGLRLQKSATSQEGKGLMECWMVVKIGDGLGRKEMDRVR